MAVYNHQRKRCTILLITKVRETVGVPDYQGNYGDNRRYYLLGQNILDKSRIRLGSSPVAKNDEPLPGFQTPDSVITGQAMAQEREQSTI